LQVHLNIYAAQEGTSVSALVEQNTKYLMGNGFSQKQGFREAVINGNHVFVGVFDKEVEQEGRILKVRSPMTLMLSKGRVYFFTIWYFEQDESQILALVTTIQQSFRVGAL
jgi:hypothetical protein